ncbi:hypothetical protein CcaverHIS002_0603790 [Cutaneotrichosporon cavernicola]|uniref:C2H2-type domain-containing protein n=1 Tax=Cutaneotrichosporon cavernicola TaxID=279322 RepID=A0AA48L8H3_9TREE|nr:uncharacterized protein CcaverHIS019_0603240 [Cutaneotrichosporon cavernicola]BEI86092.1 hypothetical protein CcaverHIS002_0603790 [Cutaneotrichosporon cavernicola]BEI93865.1 hypothetical protein CcaverHIS019_0603240 [Cutaneotrichosporon cavernicola]BEJ01643.1 hypothetical protein CcaverHIS631_0603250 [Cutaneotrichosporon cavernicola]BEJ09411.1 hypothetical protein CcaverHIS641_0603260 [Cutaneotrichosporon cavernicola]
MSLTTTAPLSYSDRPPASHLSYPPTDNRPFQNHNARPGSAHGVPPFDVSSPERLHSSGAGANVIPRVPLHDMGPAPGSSHGYPSQPVPQMGAAPYPPQPAAGQQYYGMPPQPADTTPPTSAGNGRAPAGSFTTDGAPIVPVGISGGKMFRCRGFGECDKVFTRSEHLARHVRKHTGERPFPCHCGKAFSRLDNLRQHAATVHADQTSLNEAMLASLASVHAALSQRANREQRRRGEVVEVPKNAVERPRGERNKAGQQQVPGVAPGGVPPPGYPPGAVYHQPPHGQWAPPPPHHDGRPHTAGGGPAPGWGMEYPGYPGQPPVGDGRPPTAGSATFGDDAGPSRRPPSSAGYPPHGDYYPGGPPGSSHGRPPTADAPPGTAGSGDSNAAAGYQYRPVSSNGPPGHYADSEPPTSSHGPPPHSPMYPHPGAAGVAPGGNWASPSTSHSAYPSGDPSMYPQNPALVGQEGAHPYPPGAPQDGQYGPPPPGSSGGYHYPAQQGYPYYGQQSPAQQQAAQFANASLPPGSGPVQPGHDGRKRRADEDAGGERKQLRSSNGPNTGDQRPATAGSQSGETPMWLPPTTERRQSLSINALVESHDGRASRPQTGDAAHPGAFSYPYPGAPGPATDATGARPPTNDKKAVPAE